MNNNIYDLNKQATPGPFIVVGATSIMAPSGWNPDLHPWVLGASTTVHIASTDENHLPHKEQNANAALFVHYKNNFMKALEALKYQVDPRWTTHGDECASRGPAPYDARRASDEGCNCWVKSQKELIKELEEVKS
jgi:hypothetical protein